MKKNEQYIFIILWWKVLNFNLFKNKSLREGKHQTSKRFNDIYTPRDFSNADDRCHSIAQ